MMTVSDPQGWQQRIVSFLVLAAVFIIAGCAGPKKIPTKNISEAFRINDQRLIPEGIAYDPVGQSFYVGSISRRKIVRIDEKGRASDFAVSLNQIFGMKVDTTARRLWVCGNAVKDSAEFISSVYVFSLHDGSLLKKYEISGTKRHVFNDIVLTQMGDAYITDSHAGAIYVIRRTRDAIEEFVRPGSIVRPNGITLSPDQTRLLVATAGAKGIVSVDLKTMEITPLRSDRYLLIGYDGIYRHKNSIIGIQNVTFPESVVRIECDDQITSVQRVEFIAVSVPGFDIPTTGVIVGDVFYFIANSHVNQTDDNGEIKDDSTLTEPVIMKVRL